MRLSRWIKFPALFTVLTVLPALIFLDELGPNELLFRFIFGAGFGFALQAWSDRKTRRRAGAADITEEIYRVRQTRSINVFGDRDNVLDLCDRAMIDLGNVRFIKVDREKGEIKARTKMTWDSFGTAIELQVSEIGDHLAEVTIRTKPIPFTAAIDYGQGLEIIEKLTKFLKSNDKSIGPDMLTDGAEILVAATKRPLGKDFARNMAGSSD